jgi:uncharacterized membrane protein YhhN
MISASIFLGYGVFAYLYAKMSWNTVSYAGNTFTKMFALYMLIGLACGWLGDLFLHLTGLVQNPGKVFTGVSFGVGLLAFLTGHVFYVLAFMSGITAGGRKLPYQIWIAVAVLMVIFIVMKFIAKIDLGIAAVPVALYALTISTMLVCALTFAFYFFKESAAASVIMALGAVLFVISDGTLVFNLFGSEKAKKSYSLKVVNLTTYFIGQMLLGSTIMLVSFAAVK